jgi:RimJ/RimL family protein N-acetyltransferase
MRYTKDSPLAGLKLDKGEVIVGKKVKLREKKLSDVHNDHRWQSDTELARLDASPLLRIPFPAYLLDYAGEIRKSRLDRYQLAVETFDGKHIGNCTCYDIDMTRGEVQLGIMIGDRNYWDKGYGADTITTLVNHIFLNTNIKRVYLKTLDWNLRAQKCFKNCGFTPYGQLNRDGNNFVVMELHREQWEKRQNSQT